MQPQEGQTIQVMQQKREEKEEGWQQHTSKEQLPPLQEIPLQEAPWRQPGQVHMEQEIQGISFQIYFQQAQGGFQAMSQVYGGTGRVRRQSGFGERMTVCGDRGCWEKGWKRQMDQDFMEGQLRTK